MSSFPAASGLSRRAVLRGRLAGDDRRTLDEYLTGLREIERQVARFDATPPEVPDMDLRGGPLPSYAEHIGLMADLLVLAFRTDSTRIATFMLAHDGSNRSFPEIGVQDGHNHLSHHRGNAEKLDKIARIDGFTPSSSRRFYGGFRRSARPMGGRSSTTQCSSTPAASPTAIGIATTTCR